MPLNIDLGCGPNPREGFVGFDLLDFPKAVKADLRQKTWYFDKTEKIPDECVEFCDTAGKFKLKNDSVDEAHCSHFIEHLTNLDDRWERVKFFNELHRVLKPGAKALLIFPSCASERYYGDPTHKEAISTMAFYYLTSEWRLSQAPHTDAKWNPDGYNCDLDVTWGYNLHPQIMTRAVEAQQFAMQFYWNATQDVIATAIKRVPPASPPAVVK